MLDALRLLRKAETLYDGSPRLSASAQTDAWRTAFRSGGDWMRSAMSIVRNQEMPVHTAPFAWLGFAKYALASLAALLALGASLKCWFLFPLVVVAFYAVEVQWVFLFPVAIDGSTKPWRDSRALMRKYAGTVVMMSFVLPFAWRMLTGGFFGKGFVRSWCVGCLAVVLIYERFRAMPAHVLSEDDLPPLEIGSRLPLLVREEKIALPVASPCRLLLVTDLHLKRNTAPALLASLESILHATTPRVVLLGGDLADSAASLAALEEHLPAWTKICPWVAVPGNHDHWLGLEKIKNLLITAGVHWLPDRPCDLRCDGTKSLTISALPSEVSPQEPLLKNVVPQISALHDPAEFPKAQKSGADLVLAGHLHGCQWVFAKRNGKLLPGQWFYRWNVLRAVVETSTLIVSRGCGDTLPMRWRCPREVVCCDIIPREPIA